MPTLRVMTYNVRSMRDDRAALGRVIESAHADVVLIQESPRFLRWRSLCAQLARTSGLVVVGGGRPAGSNLILCAMAVQVVSTRSVLFSKDPRLHQRGTAIAVLRTQEATFAVAGTHLDLSAAPRLRHVGELETAVAAHVPADVPTIVGGDINDHPGSPAWTALAGRRTDVFGAAGIGDGFTSTARRPHQIIDGLFADAAFAVRSARVLDGPDVLIGSDHRPLLAEVELA